MKKIFAALALGLSLVLMLTACEINIEPGNKNTEEGNVYKPATISTESKETKETEPEVDRSGWITDLIDVSGTIADEYIPVNYSYKLPVINCDSEDAENFNSEVREAVEVIREGLADNDIESIGPSEVGYNVYWTGNLASIVLYYQIGLFDPLEYEIYNFDFDLGVMVDDYDLMNYTDHTEDELYEVFQKSVAVAYDNSDENTNEYTCMYQTPQMREWTINMAAYPGYNALYLDDGEIYGIVSMASSAGNMLRTEKVRIDWDLMENHPEVDNATYENVEAYIEADGVYIQFSDPKPGQYMNCDRFQIDLNCAYYAVGEFTTYKEILMPALGGFDTPYILLLTDQGRVEWIDITGCAEAGFFCIGGPVPGVTGVRSFEIDTTSQQAMFKGPTVYAICDQGKVDLYDAISDMQLYSSMSDQIEGDIFDWVVVDYMEESDYDYRISLKPNHEITVTKTHKSQPFMAVYEGTWKYLGISRSGLVIGYSVYNRESDMTLAGEYHLDYEWPGFYEDILWAVHYGEGSGLLGFDEYYDIELIKEYK